MATPAYKGTGQPAAYSGWLSGLGSWFSVQAPVYAGAGQAASSSSGYVGGSTPAYQPAPIASPADTAGSSGDERITLVIPRELIESQQ